MDKILSIQTIKNVFAALGAKTSDSNYGVALLDKTTAEPKGLMGMSDLASVLGGVIRARFNTYTDLNDVPTDRLICGSVATANYTVNIPVQVIGMFISFPGDSSGNLASQLYITKEEPFRLYARYYWNTWSGWKQITLT